MFPVKDSLRNSRHDAPGTWNQAVLLRLVLMLVEQVHVDKAPGEEGPAAGINLPLQAQTRPAQRPSPPRGIPLSDFRAGRECQAVSAKSEYISPCLPIEES